MHELLTEFCQLVLLFVVEGRSHRLALARCAFSRPRFQEVSMVVLFTMLADYVAGTEIVNQELETVRLRRIFPYGSSGRLQP